MDAPLQGLIDRVRAAAAAGSALCIRAGGTKDFYGNTPVGETLDPRAWSGIEFYDPSELVITARAGTLLADVEAVLAANRQMLAFEPPHFGANATIGGCVAAGLAGPRRASTGTTHGGVRDFVLGARLLDGRGHVLRFGGTVMKNVAGYDMARTLAGSLGVLGIIVDVSLKVLPRPRGELTLRLESSEAQAIERLNTWGGQPLPISASAWLRDGLWLRLAGAESAIAAACVRLGGEPVGTAMAEAFWRDLREQQLDWFRGDSPLWRVALPPTAEPFGVSDSLIEWNGAQRWLRTDAPAARLRERAAHLGGHATLFRGGERADGVFTPLRPTALSIHRRLKAEFDPAGIFNRDRLVLGL